MAQSTTPPAKGATTVRGETLDIVTKGKETRDEKERELRNIFNDFSHDLLKERPSLSWIRLCLSLFDQDVHLLITVSSSIVAPFLEIGLTNKLRPIGGPWIDFKAATAKIERKFAFPMKRVSRASVKHPEVDIQSDSLELGLQRGRLGLFSFLDHYLDYFSLVTGLLK